MLVRFDSMSHTGMRYMKNRQVLFAGVLAGLLCGALTQSSSAQLIAMPTSAAIVAGDTGVFMIDGLPTDTNYPPATLHLISYDPDRVSVIGDTVTQLTDTDPDGNLVYLSAVPVFVAAHYRQEGLFDPIPISAYGVRQHADGTFAYLGFVEFTASVIDPTLWFFPDTPPTLNVQTPNVEPIVLRRTTDAFASLTVQVRTDIGQVLGVGELADPATHTDMLTLTLNPFETARVFYFSGRSMAEGVDSLTGNLFAQVGSYVHTRAVRVEKHPELSLTPLDPASGTIPAGDAFMMRVERLSPPDQHISDYVVTLSSDHPGVAAVPDTITIPGGSAWATFAVSGLAPGATLVRASGLNASLDAQGTSPVTVTDPVLQFAPVPVELLIDGTATLQVSRPNVYSGGALTLAVTAADPGVFTVSPGEIVMEPGAVSALLTLSGLAQGDSLLNVAMPNCFATNVTVQVRQCQSGLGVTMMPQAAVDDGAGWRLDGGDWQTGVSFLPLAPGEYALDFRPLAGWVTPESRTVTILSGQRTDVVGDYLSHEAIQGVLVHLAPEAAVDDGAGWRVVPGQSWQSSGSVQAIDSTGEITIEFKPLAGWLTPAPVNATITAGGLQVVERRYYQGEVLGGEGTEAGRFDTPTGLAFDNAGRLHVADSRNHRLQRLNADGSWTVIGEAGELAGTFNEPFTLLFDGDDLYVGEIGNNRVQRRDGADGSWTFWGGPAQGSATGTFYGPFDLALDADANLYVADLYNNRVQRRDAASGNWAVILPEGTGAGGVWMPSGVTWWDGELVVADFLPLQAYCRIRRFADPPADGVLIGSSEVGAGQFGRAYGLAASGDTLVAADSDRHRILFYQAADPVWRLAVDGLLNRPRAARLGPDGLLYIADTDHHRILRVVPPAFGMLQPLVLADDPLESGLYLDLLRTPVAMPAESTILTQMDDGAAHVGFTLRWPGHPGACYTLQQTDRLGDPAAWRNLPGATALPGTSGWMEFAIQPEADATVRFYRVKMYPKQ